MQNVYLDDNLSAVWSMLEASTQAERSAGRNLLRRCAPLLRARRRPVLVTSACGVKLVAYVDRRFAHVAPVEVVERDVDEYPDDVVETVLGYSPRSMPLDLSAV